MRLLAAARSSRVRVYPCELGAEQEDLRRIVDPHHHDHDGAERAKARADVALAEVQANQELSDDEEQRRDESAYPDVAPLDVRARHQLVDRAEHHRQNAEIHDDVQHMRDRLPLADEGCPPFAQGAQRRAEEKRYRYEEGQAEHHTEREQPRAHEAPDAACLLFALFLLRNPPDRVERGLELPEDAGGGEEKHGNAHYGGHAAGLGLAYMGQHLADRLGPVLTHQGSDLL